MLEGADVEGAVVVAEGHQVERGQVARRVVQEHVLRARVGGVDAAAGGARMPLVDGGVVLQAGIGARPGGVGDILPQVAGAQALGHRAVGAADQLPLAVVPHSLQEGVGHADAVVGVLARDGPVGFRLPVGVEHREGDLGVSLPGELDDPLDVVLRDHRLARRHHGFAQRVVGLDVEAVVAVAPAVVTGADDRVQMDVRQPGSGHQGRHLLLLVDLPVDERPDVRVVDVDDHHLGGAARGAARFDGAGGAVADLQEAHQARGLAAPRQGLVGGPEAGEIGARAGPVFEQARLAHPQVHDAALVDQVVVDALDETGVGLGMLVSRLRRGRFAGPVVHVPVALGRPVDAVGPVKPGVEPLGRVGRAHLGAQHVAHLVEVGAGVGLRIEVAALPAPIGPGAGQAVEDLLGAGLAAVALVLGQGLQGLFVGDVPPQPRRDVGLLDRFEPAGHPGLAQVLLGQHVAGDLGPGGRRLEFVEAEHHRAVRVADLAGNGGEGQGVVRRQAFSGEMPRDPHCPPLPFGSPFRAFEPPCRPGRREIWY